MGRPHIEFIEASDVPEQEIAEGAFAGAPCRVLSADDVDGSWTGIVRLSAGSTHDLGGGARPVELFGLRGSLTLAGAAVRCRLRMPGCRPGRTTARSPSPTRRSSS